MVRRDIHLVVFKFARRDRQQDIVAVALGRDVKAVIVEIGGVEAMRHGDQMRLARLILELPLDLFRGLFREFIAKLEQELIAGLQADRGARPAFR